MQLWQYCLLVTARSLYMFRTLSVSIIRSTENCSSSHWCMSWVAVQGRLPTALVGSRQPTLDVLTGYISSRPMACTSGCYYSFQYSWWWTQKASETCRVILHLLINNTAKVASCWFFIYMKLTLVYGIKLNFVCTIIARSESNSMTIKLFFSMTPCIVV